LIRDGVGRDTISDFTTNLIKEFLATYCSRYLHGLWPLRSTAGAGVKQSLEVHFREAGVPLALLMDHGTPWFSTRNAHGLTWVAVWLLKQGVRLHYSGVAYARLRASVSHCSATTKSCPKGRGEAVSS